MAVAEYILQWFGLFCLALATNTGQKRHFYPVNQLRPFWRGQQAHIMYSGSLFWCVVFGLFLLGLIGLFLSGHRWLKIRNAPSKEAQQAQEQKQKQTKQNLINSLPVSMHQWSRRKILRFSKKLPQIIVLPPRLSQWERKQSTKFKAAVTKINDWYYIEARQSVYPDHLPGEQSNGEKIKGEPSGADHADFDKQNDREVSETVPLRARQDSTQNSHEDILELIRKLERERERDKMKIALTIVFFTGMCTFAAQWMFWNGFVKSSGPRYV